MGNTISGGGGMTTVVNSWYEKKFLMESRKNFVLEPLGLTGTIPKHAGKVVVWNRFSVPTAKASALTDATDPTPTGLSATLLSATLAGYGNFERIGELLDMTAVDSIVEKAVDLLAYEAALSIDTVIQASISAGGIQVLAGTATHTSNLNAGDTFSVTSVRKAVNKLLNFGARKHTADRFVGTIHPDVMYDLQGDSNWVNAHIYTEKGINAIYNGEVGELYGVRFVSSNANVVLTNSGSLGAVSSDVYLTHIFGKDFFGVSKLQNLQTWVDSPSKNVVMNHASDVAWKAYFAVKVLNDSFGVRVESGSSLTA